VGFYPRLVFLGQPSGGRHTAGSVQSWAPRAVSTPRAGRTATGSGVIRRRNSTRLFGDTTHYLHELPRYTAGCPWCRTRKRTRKSRSKQRPRPNERDLIPKGKNRLSLDLPLDTLGALSLSKRLGTLTHSTPPRVILSLPAVSSSNTSNGQAGFLPFARRGTVRCTVVHHITPGCRRAGASKS